MRTIRTLVSVGAGIALVLLAVGSAAAGGPAGPVTWRVTPVHANSSAPVGAVRALSCPNVRSCVGLGPAGPHTAIYHRDGLTWTVAAKPRGYLTTLSCPTAAFCLAAGPGAADLWDGTAWTAARSPGLDVAQVSCASATACVVVGKATARSWDGARWSRIAAPAVPDGFFRTYTGLSCWSSARCLLVGDEQSPGRAEAIPVSATWDGTTWTPNPVPVPSAADPGPAGALLGLSCVRATWCVASGYWEEGYCCSYYAHTLLVRWDGTRWQAQTSPPDADQVNRYNLVACGSATSCLTLGISTERNDKARGLRCGTCGGTRATAAVWDGSTWTATSTPVVPDPSFQTFYAGLQCLGDGSCLLGGYNNVSRQTPSYHSLVERYQAAAWTIVDGVPDTRVEATAGFASVSCVTPRWCMSVGFVAGRGGPAPLARLWNGTSWDIARVPVPVGAQMTTLDSVSCAARTQCLAVGTSTGTALAAKWNGSKWLDVEAPRRPVVSLSCPTATFCAALASQAAYVWRSGVWSTSTLPAGAVLHALSCASETDCVAVGESDRRPYGVISARWDGTTWVTTPVPPLQTPGLAAHVNAVSCPAADHCLAVGATQLYGNPNTAAPFAMSLSGQDWTPTAVPPTGAGLAALTSVDCAAPSACTAGGYSLDGPPAPGAAKIVLDNFDGSTWTAAALPATAARSEVRSVSCAIPAQCMAVGASYPTSDASYVLALRGTVGRNS